MYHTGPLTAIVNGKVTVVGINSYVQGACMLKTPQGFARVSFQKDWILQNSDAGIYQCPGIRFDLLEIVVSYRTQILEYISFRVFDLTPPLPSTQKKHHPVYYRSVSLLSHVCGSLV